MLHDYFIEMTFRIKRYDLRHDLATLMLRWTKNLVDVQHAMGAWSGEHLKGGRESLLI